MSRSVEQIEQEIMDFYRESLQTVPMNDQERKALEAAREALHRHVAHWMAVAPILGADAWTRWTEVKEMLS